MQKWLKQILCQHKLCMKATILRKIVNNGNSKKIFYGDCKSFHQKKFETKLKLKFNLQTNVNYSDFQAVFLGFLVTVLPFNNNALMTKSLKKAMVHRSGLKIFFFFLKDLMKTGINIRSKEIFVLNYSARPKQIFLWY